MSVESIAAVLHHSKAAGTDKVVLIGIANHEGDGGSWPAVSTLAKYAQCSERAVRYSLKRLIDSGELMVRRQAGGNENTRPDRRTNLYRVNVSCPDECSGGANHRVRGEATFLPDDDGVKQASERGEAGFRDGVKPTAAEPSLEPSKNHTKNRRSAMTEEWTPTEANILKLRVKYPDIDPMKHLDMFRDHHISTGNMFVDWDAAFRKWIANTNKWQRTDKATHTPTARFPAGSGGIYL